MAFDIVRIDLLSLAGERAPLDVPGSPVTKDITISVAVTESAVQQFGDGGLAVQSTFIAEIEGRGKISATVASQITVEDEQLVLEHWENDRSLPSPVKERLDDGIYFYLLPVITTISEKLSLPPPVLPLFGSD